MAGKKPKSTTSMEDLVNEVQKVKAQIQQLANDLTNPELNLGDSVRLTAQQRELEAYLCGILYALGEAEPLEAP
jgi:hypothetical protein